jgi:hypothetical protein
MSYADFTLSSVTRQFNLTLDTTTDLYSHVSEVAPDPAFLVRLEDEVSLALAVSTEKARSEFIIAPILSEVRRMSGRRISLLSGVEFTVDPEKGLSGVCDYVITRSPQQFFIEAPVLMLVEAKNEDMKRGYAQCIAEMLAAQAFNAREGVVCNTIYGAVTLGERWKFLELEGTTARIDAEDYYIEHVAKIMGILLHVTTGQPSAIG